MSFQDSKYFPRPVPLTAIGTNQIELETFVADMIRGHAAELVADTLRSRTSRGGRYCSVSLTMIVENQQQLEAIYQSLSDAAEIRFLF